MELMVDYIASLDGYGAAEGWPGWWGLEGPEYLAWLGEDSKNQSTLLMGANTYRLMHSFAPPAEADDELGKLQKIVFSNTLEEPLEWANSRLVRGDAVEAVRELKRPASIRCRRSAASRSRDRCSPRDSSTASASSYSP